MSPCPAARDLSAAQYAEAARRAAALIDGADDSALNAAVGQVTALAGHRHFESAARLRDRTATAVEVLWRGQRLRALAALPELIAAAPDGGGAITSPSSATASSPRPETPGAGAADARR